MKNKLFYLILLSFFLSACAGVSSKGIFGTGVSIALDPRTLGTQIDDSIMEKNLGTKLKILFESENKNGYIYVPT